MKSLAKFKGSYTLVLGAALAIIGCGYGKVSSHTYEYAKSLFSICNQKDEARLNSFAEQVAADVESGKLPADEAELLNDIVSQARQGEWQSANEEVRRMMEDQVQGY